MERRLISVQRDCPARLVPTGDEIQIPKDTFVTLTQTLGGAFTVVVNGNMARIDGRDADAIGLPVMQLEFEAPTDGRVRIAQVDQALASIFDPEIPVNIQDLGLIYHRQVNEQGVVTVQMTLTAPGCGMGPVLIDEVRRRLLQVPFVTDVVVDLVFDPPWSRDMMSEEAQLELGIF